MLILEKTSEDSLSVKCNFSNDYVNRFRQVPGARFDKEQKRWVMPIGAFMWFKDVFEGEIIYKTPKWIIENEPMPDYSQMYKIDDIELPKLKIQPYDYQQYGTKFMIDRLLKNKFVINADDVGLGKTLQAIDTMYWLFNNHKIKRVLIACKKSLKRQWISEIDKFTDIPKRITSTFVEGDKKKRSKTYDLFTQSKWGVLVVNYHTVMNDYDILKAMDFDLLVIDEAHCVKARTGVMNEALSKVAKKADYTMFLTGTPIMSKPDDIFGVIQIADKKYFGKWKDFEKKHMFLENNGRWTKLVGYKELDVLRDKVQDIVIRRTEHEVSLELPSIVAKQIECTIDNVQVKLQNQVIADRTKYSGQVSSIRSKSFKSNEDKTMLIRLEGMVKGLTAASQAIANDPRLFYLSKSNAMKEKYCPLVPQTYKMSSKTEALIDLVENVRHADEKIIIFSKFERATRLLKDDIEKALGEKVVLYTGTVDDEQRETNIELFKTTTDHNILIATDAGAEGLNLQICNHVVNYDLPDTPAIKTQRAGRARRIGSQFKRVYTYDLITLESKDVERLENLEKASNLFDGIVSLNEAQSEAIKHAMSS